MTRDERERRGRDEGERRDETRCLVSHRMTGERRETRDEGRDGRERWEGLALVINRDALPWMRHEKSFRKSEKKA